MRRLAQILHVKGHPTDSERLFTGEWIRGALLMAWALGVGTFIVLGGGFRSPVYTALIETFRCTRPLGYVLIVAGMMGAVGTWADWRRMTQASCLILALWHAMFFGYTLPANLGVFGNSNLISLFALLVSLLYLVQFYVLWGHPTRKAITR